MAKNRILDDILGKAGAKIRMKPLINVGCGIDIPTGNFVTGARGEKIVLGGLSGTEGFAGLGNNFKSTIMHFFMIRAMDRMTCSLGEEPEMLTYDTEDNMIANIEHLEELVGNLVKCSTPAPISDGVWKIISKSMMSSNTFLQKVLYPFIEENKKLLVKYTAFIDKTTNKPMELPRPSFVEIDSITEFEPEMTMDFLKENNFEKANMLFMTQGRYKSVVLKDFPRLANEANVSFMMVAHMGEKKDIGGNPYSQPTKELQFLKQNEKVKGSDKLFYLTSHFWKVYGAKSLKNQTTKLPEYPKYEDDVETDLNIVNLLQFRSKTGPSGYVLELIVSQNEGVLPGLTNFHYIKTNKFGIDGNPRSYWIELYPDVKLSRTTVRTKIEEDELLERAIEITSDLLQIRKFKPALYKKYKDYAEPKKLYERLKELGYDWNVLLKTRGWWTIDQYTDKLPPFLSTYDLLRMAYEEYVPYWMDKDKKVKKEWEKHFKES